MHIMINTLFNSKNFKKILIFSFILKLLIIFYFGENEIPHEWQTITQNLINNSSLTYYIIDSQNIPTVYMPPLYNFYSYLFLKLQIQKSLAIELILLSQVFISTLTVFIFLKSLKFFFSKKLSYFLALVYLFYPLNFYSSSQISSITLQSFFFISFIYYFFIFSKKKNFIFFAIFSGLSILIRGEFYLLFFLSLLFLFYENTKNIKKILFSFLICILLISPYIYRNLIHFDQIIITKSFGYNLWRGNNIYADVNGNTFNDKKYKNMLEEKQLIINELKKEKKLKYFEIYYDDYFKKKAFNNIKNEPSKYIYLYVKKLLYFLFFNPESTYQNYFNPLVFIPEIIISTLSFFGLVRNLSSKDRNYKLFFIIMFYLMIIPIFFVLPRYKLFILPILIIYLGYFLKSNQRKSIFSKKQ